MLLVRPRAWHGIAAAIRKIPNRKFSLAATVACDACKSAKLAGARAAASSALRNAHDIIPLPGIRSAKIHLLLWLINRQFHMLCRLRICCQSSHIAQGCIRLDIASRGNAPQWALGDQLYEKKSARATRTSQSIGLRLCQAYWIQGELRRIRSVCMNTYISESIRAKAHKFWGSLRSTSFFSSAVSLQSGLLRAGQQNASSAAFTLNSWATSGTLRAHAMDLASGLHV